MLECKPIYAEKEEGVTSQAAVAVLGLILQPHPQVTQTTKETAANGLVNSWQDNSTLSQSVPMLEQLLVRAPQTAGSTRHECSTGHSFKSATSYSG